MTTANSITNRLIELIPTTTASGRYSRHVVLLVINPLVEALQLMSRPHGTADILLYLTYPNLLNDLEHKLMTHHPESKESHAFTKALHPFKQDGVVLENRLNYAFSGLCQYLYISSTSSQG